MLGGREKEREGLVGVEDGVEGGGGGGVGGSVVVWRGVWCVC